jgi:hypothetical protein
LKRCRRRRGILPGLVLQSHNHQGWCRRRFDCHSGLLTTWCGHDLVRARPGAGRRTPSVVVAGSRREYLAADKPKIYITVKLSSVTQACRGPDPDDRPKFNVANYLRGQRSGQKHFYDRVIRELTDKSDFSLELWNFRGARGPGDWIFRISQSGCRLLTLCFGLRHNLLPNIFF